MLGISKVSVILIQIVYYIVFCCWRGNEQLKLLLWYHGYQREGVSRYTSIYVDISILGVLTQEMGLSFKCRFLSRAVEFYITNSTFSYNTCIACAPEPVSIPSWKKIFERGHSCECRVSLITTTISCFPLHWSVATPPIPHTPFFHPVGYFFFWDGQKNGDDNNGT